MRVLLVNKFLYPKGGDAICTLSTGRLLAEKGHQVSYWGMAHPDNPPYPHANLFVDYVDLADGGGAVRQIRAALNILYSREAKRKFRRVIDAERPDIVHLHNFAHQISPSILDVLDEYAIPVVMTMHDYKLACPAYTLLADGKLCERCAGGRYYWCFLRKCTHASRLKSVVNMFEMYLHHKILRLYDKISLFISPSAFLKQKVKEMGLSLKIVHVPNFVDLRGFQPRYDVPDRRLVYFGRLSPEKGLLTLLDAVKGLGVALRIVGDGPLRAEAEHRVQAEGIGNVTFVGYKTGEALHAEIGLAMATVLPSEWYENNPLSILESFALGKPAIGARIGGIPELVMDGETGYTFRPGSAQDLRASIQRLMQDPRRAAEMGRAARRLVERRNNPQMYYERLMGCYRAAGACRGALARSIA